MPPAGSIALFVALSWFPGKAIKLQERKRDKERVINYEQRN
jgi:hypothetical protein